MKSKFAPKSLSIILLSILFIALPAKYINAAGPDQPEEEHLIITIEPEPLKESTQIKIPGKYTLIKIKDALIHDYSEFYSPNNLLKFSLGIGIAAIFANTRTDQNIENWYQDEVRSDGLNDFSKSVKLFGEGKIIIPAFLSAAILGELSEKFSIGTTTGSYVGTWGKKSLRAILVGAPPLLLFQQALGASRPDEFQELGEEESRERHNSYYRFFKDENGVSGHAFMGAIPFLTAAEMSDKLYIKIPLYGLSLLPALSRINDGAHYFSQSALGWWLAYLSTKIVFKEPPPESFSISPMISMPDDHLVYGVSLNLKW